MKLIGALTSPYVRKVRVVMAEKKLDYSFVAENVWAPDTTINESNPLGKVPCLIMEGGEALFDSRVIVEYLDTLSPVGKLIPSLGRERAEVKTWEALADGLLDAAILATWKRLGMAARMSSAAKPGSTARWTKSPPASKPWARAWGTRHFAAAFISVWRTSPSAAHWVTWTSASRKLSGVPTMPTWRNCRRS